MYFGNGCITKLCLKTQTNMSYNDPVSQLLRKKDTSNINIILFSAIGFDFYEGKLIKKNSIRFVTTAFQDHPFSSSIVILPF
jgi:hypothetical protein